MTREVRILSPEEPLHRVLTNYSSRRQHEQLTAASAHRGRDVQPRSSPPPDGSESSDSEDGGKEPPKSGGKSVPSKRSLDDEGDRADAGKRRIDESIIPFAQSSDLSGLGPDLQATLKLKENYTRNLEQAKQLVISNPEVPEFPQALWKDVLANNFVDLDKTGDLKASKNIRSHGEWSIAWNAYSDAVTFAYPHRQRELRLYNAEITRLFAATLLESADRVIQFDRAVRSRVAKSNRVLLSDFGSFNDLGISHFSNAGAGSSKAPSKAQASGSRNPNTSGEICRRFNDGTCAARSCKYRHVCFTCKARDHGSHMCGKASGSGTQPKLERK
ncbi:hypothetical protein EWM64_g1981 [Hericium alpestre]|uniref:C3H1-type domain-containing protein n=1 Tax=Hericium alpestre TaxID=135208 RepID=A0A4Z0A6C7_9AGAM|nr:hypothetical protein EWM64_g1981 [Hericium alpestre]